MVKTVNNLALDRLDFAILAALVQDSKIANNTLAARLGLAQSTTLVRVKSLIERGIIRGFTVELDYSKLGRGVQAMIALQLRTHHEKEVRALSLRVRALPEVIQTFHVAGNTDFIIHVAVSTPEQLRDFILQSLTSDTIVRGAQTSLVYEHQLSKELSK